MRIIGIDCGSERTGYGVIETDGRTHTLVDTGVIRTSPKAPLAARLCTIAAGLRAVIDKNLPESAAVEGIFHSVNAQTALKLAHVRGVALLVLAEAGLEVGEYSPMEIKTSVVGYGRAEKAQVQMMVCSILHLKEILSSQDASDALAAAICHANQFRYAEALRL